MNPLRNADWGVFSVTRSGIPSLVHTKEWKSPGNVAFAIQAGPRLIVDGKPLTFKPNLARRSALCISGPRTVILVATAGPVLLSELAAILLQPSTQGGFGCTYALNLDGGPSTQLHVAVPGSKLGISGIDEVPIAIGVFRRKRE